MPRVAEISVVEERLSVALGHPLRVELLRHYIEETTSPNDLAVKLSRPLGDISYHTKVLLEAHCIELVRTEPRRGAVAHFYRGLKRPVIDEKHWTALSAAERSEITGLVLSNLFAEAYAALREGVIDKRMDRHLTWRSLVLDLKGWAEFMQLLLQTFHGVEAIEARSASRRTASGEEPISAICGLLGFERASLR